MRKWLSVMLLGLVIIGLLGCSKSSKKDAPDFVGIMLAEINSHRTVGQELTYDAAVAAVAHAHAVWLDSQNTSAYQSTGSGGSTPSSRLTAASITYSSSGETGCWSAGDIAVAYAAMNTSTLTNSTFTHVGIGRVL